MSGERSPFTGRQGLMMSSGKTIGFSWLVGILVVALVGAAMAGAIGKVYFGNPRNYQRPAELEAAKVFQVIPEYEEWQKLEPSDPRYWTLLDKANTRFIRALVTVARKYGYDLIGEKGFLRGQESEQKVTDITLLVLDEIQQGSGR